MQTDFGFFNIDKSGNKNSSRILVFIHGLPTGNFIWRNITPSFEEEYQVIAIELLGCGDSDKNPKLDYSIKTQAQAIAHILKQYNNKAIDIVGHDIGTGVIQRILVDYPHLVSNTVLLNPIGYDYWPIKVVKLWRTPIVSVLLNALFNKQFMEKVISDGIYYVDKFDKNLLHLYTKNFNTPKDRQAIRKLMLSLDSKYLMEIVPKLKTISNNVLIIRAKEDVYLTPEISNKLFKDIPNSNFIELERCGHFIQEDIPEKLCEIIHKFLKEKQSA